MDLNIAGNIISDDKHKTEALGNQFKSVFTLEINSKLPNLNYSPHGKISKINTSKSQGPDGIPPWFLNRYASHLTPIIYDIFQSSLVKSPKPGTKQT